MKRLSFIITSILLAVLIAAVMPAQVFADSVPEYISEVKVGMDKKAADAKAALAGYVILSDEDGNPVDLNKKAGGGWGSKGEKVVYLGYKTTTDRGEAITDLALMNMKGGYSVQEYEALMEAQMKSQIIPFVDSFLVAINEYRENLKSENPANRQRAEYIKGILNKFIDDDTGKGLGDLLVNETKYEMGIKVYNEAIIFLPDGEKEKTDVIKESDKAFEKLSEEEKKNHADILTILAQSNGKATLMTENLITRTADTADDTWLDRFAGITYDDLLGTMEMLPTDAESEAAKLYYDDAVKILGMWDSFASELGRYEECKKYADKCDTDTLEENVEIFSGIDENPDRAELTEAVKAYNDAVSVTDNLTQALEIIGIHDALQNIGYGDATLFDFFTTPEEEISKDISVLYPLVAALSDGQRAGLDFVSLKELVLIAMSASAGYDDVSLDEIEKTSIYDGVDRAIYQKGGVALTSDALRTKAAQVAAEDDGEALSNWTLIVMAVTEAIMISTIGTAVASNVYESLCKSVTEAFNAQLKAGGDLSKFITEEIYVSDSGITLAKSRFIQDVYASRSAMCFKLSIGLGIATIILAGVTTYLAYRDMVEYYKVEFTPVPHYMVDEKDIVVFNEKGEKTVLKNQAAYYKAVECNRNFSDEFYGTLGTCADMNGDVGKQWLALYAQKSDVSAPILAKSLVAKVSEKDVPAGYTTGIHMFGSGSAFNLNSELYDWNKDAPSVMVYFKTETSSAASTSGSTFTAGSLALAGGAGLVLGALVSAVAVSAADRKKRKAS